MNADVAGSITLTKNDNNRITAALFDTEPPLDDHLPVLEIAGAGDTAHCR